MRPGLAVSAVDLGKEYRIGARGRGYNTARDALAGLVSGWFSPRSNGRPSSRATIWALRNVCLEVRQGEALGVIGRNGAGKSTLLKILSRVTEPTRGYAEVRGRVGSLLEVGTGFHPELTGRDNIFLSGAILGMRRREIAARFDAIVDFAEVARFLDTPVKHYSSGMYLRLAFAVAAHLEPEILLVDEVLAVGDMLFQRKCLDRMRDIGARGQTILFVSHDLSVVSRLAATSLVLERGEAVFFGPTEEAIQRYATPSLAGAERLGARSDRGGDGMVRLEALEFRDEDGRPLAHAVSGGPLRIAITLSSGLKRLRLEDLGLYVKLTDLMGYPAATLSTHFGPGARGALDGGGTLECQVASLPLSATLYSVDLWLSYRGVLADAVNRAGQLQVVPADYYGTGHEPVQRKHGPALVQHSWRVETPSDEHPCAAAPTR